MRHKKRKVIEVLIIEEGDSMDPATLEANLTAALSTIVTDEATLSAAVAAVQGVVLPTGVDPNDALVTSLVDAFETAGYTVTAPAPATPPAPAPSA